MKRLLPFLAVPAVLAILLVAACDRPEPADTHRQPAVFVSNYPLYYLVDRLAGADVEIIWLIPEGEDPAFWSPSVGQIQEIQSADLLVFIGATYEKWADTVSLDPERIVVTGEAFRDRWIQTEQQSTHSHGPEGDHSHGGTAFTLWLDMEQAVIIAEETAGALANLLPERQDDIVRTLDGIREDFGGVHRVFLDAPVGSRVLLASHPVYQYFSRSYAPGMKSLLWEPGLYPSPEEWRNLDTLAAESGSDVMVWEGEPLDETRRGLEDRGIDIIVIDPCFNVPENGDFLSVMKSNAEGFASYEKP